MNQLSALVRMLVEYAQNGNWLVVAFIASYVLFLNLKSIQEFFDKQNAKRGDFLKNSVELKSLSDTTRKVLEEELEYLIFKKITKISADKYMREAIFQVIEKSEGDLQMSSITRTREFIKMKDKKLVFELGLIDWVQHKIFLFAAGYMVLLAFISFAGPIGSAEISVNQFVMLYALGAIFLTFAIFLTLQATPYAMAKRISQKVAKFQEAQKNT